MITPDRAAGASICYPIFEPFVRPDRLINPIASFFQAEQARLPLDRGQIGAPAVRSSDKKALQRGTKVAITRLLSVTEP
jgi:hypothetical protein